MFAQRRGGRCGGAGMRRWNMRVKKEGEEQEGLHSAVAMGGRYRRIGGRVGWGMAIGTLGRGRRIANGGWWEGWVG